MSNTFVGDFISSLVYLESKEPEYVGVRLKNTKKDFKTNGSLEAYVDSRDIS